MRRIAAFAAPLLLALVLASPAAGQETAAVSVQDNAYAPRTVTITDGGTVTWTHGGSNPHTVTADDGSFDSHPDCEAPNFQNCMQSGETYSRTFTTGGGSVPYYCKIHGGPGGSGMAGVVQVEPHQDPAPTTGAPTLPPVSGPAATPLPHTGGSAAWPALGLALATAALGLAAALRRRTV